MQNGIFAGKLKGTLFSCLLFLMTAECLSQKADLKLLVAVDGFAPALKVGLKKDLSDRFSIQGSAGFFIMGPSPLSWNVFGSYRITDPEKPLGINLNFGLLDNYVVPSEPMVSLGFGGGAGVSYTFHNNSTLSFRLGVLAGPSISHGEYRTLALPNYGIEYAFPLRGKR